jgi:hypothetical protein
VEKLLRNSVGGSRTTIPEELLGANYSDFAAMSSDERGALLKDSFYRLKAIRSRVGIPSGLGAKIPVAEADRKYRAFVAQAGTDSPEGRWVRQFYSQILLSQYGLLEKENPALTAFYVREHVETGCENPVVAGKALKTLDGYLPRKDHQSLSQRVRQRLDEQLRNREELAKTYSDARIREMETLQRQL